MNPETLLDWLTAATLAGCLLLTLKWLIDPAAESRRAAAMVRAHMRRQTAAKRGFRAMSRADVIAPRVGLVALALLPVLLLAFVAVALYQLGML